MKLEAVLSIILLTVSLHATAEPAFRKKDMKPDPRLPDHITEASGAAVSGANKNFLWVVNDSGGSNEIHLIQSDGTSRGSVKVKAAKNRDWEDLAGFSSGGENFLMIADTGDNDSKRDFCTLYVVREPALPQDGKSLDEKIPLAWKIDFTWEGGPRDCESVAIDPTSEKILLVSKRTSPPEVHELPLRPNGKRTMTKKIGTVRVMAPSLSFIKYRNQPTGMDISVNGNRAVIVTYYGLFVFDRKKDETWSVAFAGKSLTSNPHGLPQAEAVALSHNNGRLIFALSEGKGTKILALVETK